MTASSGDTQRKVYICPPRIITEFQQMREETVVILIQTRHVMGNLCSRLQQCMQTVGNHHKGHNWKVNCVWNAL